MFSILMQPLDHLIALILKLTRKSQRTTGYCLRAKLAFNCIKHECASQIVSDDMVSFQPSQKYHKSFTCIFQQSISQRDEKNKLLIFTVQPPPNLFKI